MIKTYLLLFKFCTLITFLAAQKIEHAIHWQSESLLSFQSLAQAPSGETFVGGIFQEQLVQGQPTITARGGNDLFIAELDKNGNPLWLQTGGSDRNETVKKIIHSEDKIIAIGTYWLTGIFDSLQLQAKGSSESIFLLQYQDTGNINWAISIDGTGNKQINDLVADEAGNLLLTGTFQGSLMVGNQLLGMSDHSVFFLLKFDATGQLIWAKQSDPVEGAAEGIAMTILANQQIVLAGNFRGRMQIEESLLETNTDDRDIFIANFSSEGVFLWVKKVGGVLEDRTVAVGNVENDFFVAGNFLGRLEVSENLTLESVGLNQNIFLLAYSAQGNSLWANSIGGASAETLSSMDIKRDRIVLGGYFLNRFEVFPYEIEGDENSLDGFVLNYDLIGNPLWLRSIDADKNILINDIAFSTTGKIKVVGDFIGNAFFDEFQFNTTVFNPFLLQISTEISSTVNQKIEGIQIEIVVQEESLQILSDQHIEEAQIFDLQGRLLTIYFKKTTFPLPHLASGIHMIRVITDDGKIGTKLFLIP